MANTIVTKDIGGATAPIGALSVEPDHAVLDASAGTDLVDSGLLAPFVADLLSACLAHERCGVHLYRSVAARTGDLARRERYEEFEAETLGHVRRLEELIASAGGNPSYVSPAARATELAAGRLLESTFSLEATIDAETSELAMLEAVMLAEAKDHANWELLSLLPAQMPEGELRTQFEMTVAEVLAQEIKHEGWAREERQATLYALATGLQLDPAAVGAAEVDAAVAEVAPEDLGELNKAELYEQAKELDIEGRSQMTKAELAEAVAEHTATT